MLRENIMEHPGIKALGLRNSIHNNTEDNLLGDEGATHIARALERNITIRSIGLGILIHTIESNNIGTEGANSIGKALESNNYITILILGIVFFKYR